jgi:hypothetical protein
LSPLAFRKETRHPEQGVSAPARRPATYQDVLALPEHEIGEIIDGELIVSSRPAHRHARASSRLGGMLDGPFDRGSGGPGGWIILDEPELINPVTRTLEVFRLSDGSWLAATLHSEDVARIEPFDAIGLDVNSPWAD